MRDVPQAMTRAWASQAKIGDQKPTIRATIQKAHLRKFDYDTAWAGGGDYEPDRHRRGTFTSMIFGDPAGVWEIRNIQTCSWKRSLDQDVAECTITLLNNEMQPIGNPVEGNPTEGARSIDKPGYFTYNRGQQTISENRWGFDTDTGWQDMFVPDRLVKTYEGYGSNPDVAPENDENLVQTGTWLIDTVSYTHDGNITLTMRDLGRLLLTQIVFPPVIPFSEYPLSWGKIRSEQVPSRDCVGGSWTGDRLAATASSSNEEYVGKGLENPPFGNYVGPTGGVSGHHPNHALRLEEGKYWLSTGQESTWSKVWWQADLDDPAPSVGAIRLSVRGGPYRVYVSLHNGNRWVGRKKIPYKVTTGDVDIDANIPFVASGIADRNGRFEIVLPRAYKNVERVRVTFTRLEDASVGKYPWRAGLRFMRLYRGATDTSLTFEKGTKLKQVGNYRDYTDIVKWVCAWGGFFWPPHDTGMDFVRVGKQADDPSVRERTISYDQADPVLPKGRVWGDFMKSGTAGEADLTVDKFDKQPLMDIINYVRDLLGFNFFVDETGGIVWRMPNLWKLGNYLSPVEIGKYTRPRTTTIPVIDEEGVLQGYSTTLNSGNIRDRIFVANVTGQIGIVAKGFNPYPTGQRSVAGWTDQNFKTERETRVMADMINARSMFEYRRSQVTIPGYPGIQMDDQIRIFERVTNETYYHYVLGISSEHDMESGDWTYTLDTHWLGERPQDAWVVNVEELDAATKAYLNLAGGDGGDDVGDLQVGDVGQPWDPGVPTGQPFPGGGQ